MELKFIYSFFEGGGTVFHEEIFLFCLHLISVCPYAEICMYKGLKTLGLLSPLGDALSLKGAKPLKNIGHSTILRGKMS